MIERPEGGTVLDFGRLDADADDWQGIAAPGTSGTPEEGALYLALLASIGFCWLALLLREPTIGFQKFGSGPGEGIHLSCHPAICGHCFRSGSIRPPRQPVAASRTT